MVVGKCKKMPDGSYKKSCAALTYLQTTKLGESRTVPSFATRQFGTRRFPSTIRHEPSNLLPTLVYLSTNLPMHYSNLVRIAREKPRFRGADHWIRITKY